MLRYVKFVKRYCRFRINYDICNVIGKDGDYFKHLKLKIMAKINDFKRLHVIQALFELVSAGDNPFIDSVVLNSFKIEFGEENKHTGLGKVKVSASHYDAVHGKFDFCFYGVYNHLFEHCCFKSVQIDREFKSSVLLSINVNKISSSWFLEEEGEEGDALGEHAGVCPEAVVADVDSDFYTKYCAVNSMTL